MSHAAPLADGGTGTLMVLASAEPYGFGPISKLTALSSELLRRGHEVNFVGTGTALDFAANNWQSFSAVETTYEPSALNRVVPERPDVVLSVMDPILIAWASANGLPSVYVDSLFWAWDWPSTTWAVWSSVAVEIANLRSAADAVAAIRALPMHAAQFVAHQIASISCVQQTGYATDRVTVTAHIGDVRPVEAIVDLTERSAAPRSGWLASTSGVLSELLSFPAAVSWTTAMTSLLEDAIAGIDLTGPVVLAGNQRVLKDSRPVKDERIVKTPLSHRDLLQQLNRSVACIAPPGLTTLLEAVGYATPMILLPAQHYGHTANLRMVNGDADPPAFPGAFLPVGAPAAGVDVQEATSYLLGALDEAERDRGSTWGRLVDALTAAMVAAEADSATMASRQQHAITGLVAGFDGVHQVVDAIETAW